MTKQFVRALVAASCLGVIAISPARADMTVTWHMTMDSPMMKNMPDQTRSMMDTMMNPMTITYSGKFSRTDTPIVSIIIDRTAQKMITINKFGKTYSVSPLDPNKGPNMPMMGGAMGGGTPADVNVTNTGNTKTLLGHKCHELIVTGKIQREQGPNMSFKDDMWVASDISPLGGTSGLPLGSFGAMASKIDGFPLEMTMAMSGGQVDGTTVTIETTNISTDAVPASTFQVPDGYTKTDGPGFGMPMGAGVPGAGGMRPSIGAGVPGAGE